MVHSVSVLCLGSSVAAGCAGAPASSYSSAFSCHNGTDAPQRGIRRSDSSEFSRYAFIPANAVTRALPYLLLGALLRRHSERLFLVNPLLWGGLLVLGVVLAITEILLLSFTGKLVYIGHTIGYGFVAFALSCIALVHPEEELGIVFCHARCLSRFIYAFHQPVGFFLPLMLSLLGERFAAVFLSFGGIAVFIFTLLPALLVGAIEYGFRRIVDIL